MPDAAARARREAATEHAESRGRESAEADRARARRGSTSCDFDGTTSLPLEFVAEILKSDGSVNEEKDTAEADSALLAAAPDQSTTETLNSEESVDEQEDAAEAGDVLPITCLAPFFLQECWAKAKS